MARNKEEAEAFASHFPQEYSVSLDSTREEIQSYLLAILEQAAKFMRDHGVK